MCEYFIETSKDGFQQVFSANTLILHKFSRSDNSSRQYSFSRINIFKNIVYNMEIVYMYKKTN